MKVQVSTTLIPDSRHFSSYMVLVHRALLNQILLICLLLIEAFYLSIYLSSNLSIYLSIYLYLHACSDWLLILQSWLLHLQIFLYPTKMGWGVHPTPQPPCTDPPSCSQGGICDIPNIFQGQINILISCFMTRFKFGLIFRFVIILKNVLPAI